MVEKLKPRTGVLVLMPFICGQSQRKLLYSSLLNETRGDIPLYGDTVVDKTSLSLLQCPGFTAGTKPALFPVQCSQRLPAQRQMTRNLSFYHQALRPATHLLSFFGYVPCKQNGINILILSFSFFHFLFFLFSFSLLLSLFIIE